MINKLVFKTDNGECPIDLELDYLFGKPPKTILKDDSIEPDFEDINYDIHQFRIILNGCVAD